MTHVEVGLQLMVKWTHFRTLNAFYELKSDDICASFNLTEWCQSSLKANEKGKLECVRDECDNYDPYKNYDPDYGFKCGECHPVNIARDWVINGFGVAKVCFIQSS